jgi:hypothetical protein
MAKTVTRSKPVRPAHTLRHRSLEVAIWRNQTSHGSLFKVTITRSYKKDETWHRTQGLGYDDLMNLAKLMYDAHSWISAERAKESAARTESSRSMN